jgi:hypothetical protein
MGFTLLFAPPSSCSKPMSAMSAKLALRLFFMVLAAYCAFLSSQSIKSVLTAGYFDAAAVRLRVLRLRNGTVLPAEGPLPSATAVGLAAFGLLRDGCRAPRATAIFRGGVGLSLNATATLLLNTSGLFNGYFVQPESFAGGRDPVSWTVEAAASADGPWVAVGASVWRADRRLGTVEYFPYLTYDNREVIDSQTGGLVSRVIGMDLRFPRAWFIVSFARMFYVVALLVPAMAASMPRGSITVNEAMACSMAVAGLLSAATAVVNSNSPKWRESAYEWVVGVTHIMFALSVYLAERRFFLAFGMLASSNLASFIVLDILLYQDRWLAAGRRQVLSLGFFGTLLTLAVLVLRLRSLARARSLVLADRRCYDAAWAELLSADGAAADISAVCEEVLRLSCSESESRPCLCGERLARTARQLNYSSQTSDHYTPDSGVSRVLSLAPLIRRQATLFYAARWAGTIDPALPVDSLDQLYAQVCCTFLHFVKFVCIFCRFLCALKCLHTKFFLLGLFCRPAAFILLCLLTLSPCLPR